MTFFLVLLVLMFIVVWDLRQRREFLEPAPSLPIYIINLKRRRDRLERILSGLRGSRWIVVEAVDGNSLSPNQSGPNLTRGEIGCFLSHVKALEMISEGSDEYALVVEDDAHVRFPDPSLTRLISDALQKKVDALALGYNSIVNGDMYGAHAILYSKKSARAYLEDFKKHGPMIPYDLWVSRSKAAVLHVASPPYIRVHTIYDTDTQRIQ